MISLVFFHILLAVMLCFVILLQKPEGTISVAGSKNQSSRSENVVLNNLTIGLSILFFSLSLSFTIYSEKKKQSYTINQETKEVIASTESIAKNAQPQEHHQ